MMMKRMAAALVAACATGVWAEKYEANWESLDKRPTPQWWTEAKFGIFVHWGVYAVPSYAPTNVTNIFDGCYSEWYHGFMLGGKQAFLEHHAKRYGKMPYGNFTAHFKAENFDPSAWAELFRKAGAKYAVLTSKHHDGFALWPSSESPYYNAVAMGPGRDLAGDFTKAMKMAGLKSGFYFSMMEYANPLYPKHNAYQKKSGSGKYTTEQWAHLVNLPQLKELVEKYEADIIWPDGEWDYSAEEHRSQEFLAWLFNESKMKDTVVVNDRWGTNCRGKHGGHYTTEYAFEGGTSKEASETHPWEECRGIGRSFGFNRFETPDQYMSRERCVETLVRTVSGGGNLLLNVGPTADGLIPAIMQDRLLAMGAWLKVNGEAIYGTTNWREAPKDLAKGGVYFTRKGDDLYMIVFAKGGSPVRVSGAGAAKSVSLLGSERKVAWNSSDGALEVEMPVFAAGNAPCEHALVFKISR